MTVKPLRPASLRLAAQMTLMSLVLVILSALAVGVPAILLLRQQLDRQAWALVEQGSQTLQAAFAGRASDLNNLAILTAQRPTLHHLLQQGDSESLIAYLEVLQKGSALDVIAVCTAQGEILVQSGGPLPSQACRASVPGMTRPWGGEGAKDFWLLASQEVALPQRPPHGGYTVVVGHALDQAFMQELQRQSGLEVILLGWGTYVASSLVDGAQAWTSIGAQMEEQRGSGAAAKRVITFIWGEKPYYALRQPLGEGEFELVAALSVADLVASRNQLSRTMAKAILLVIVFGASLAILLAQRLSRPLERLRAAALALRQGDLSTPVTASTRLYEIAQVSFALEDARIALQHSLETLRKEKAWVDALLEAVVEGIITLDGRGRVTFFSQGAERISGWHREQALGRYIDEIFTLVEGGERFSQALPKVGGKRVLGVQVQDGRQLTLAITRAHLAPPEASRSETALVLRDVTDEQALHRLLGDFLANITHEFRTPLSALAASIELLLDQLPTLDPTELRELLNSLRLGTLGLQTLVDNLLEGASIEAGRFRVRPQETDLGQVMDETLHLMQPLLEKYGQNLVVHRPEALPPVSADPRRTAQALVNLLSNAIKWSPPGATITLEVQSSGEEVLIAVADCGPGIPPEHIEQIFTRFAHLQRENARAEYGAGLGLSVVKAIVGAQGGRLGVENRPEGGARFWFTVPLARRADGEEPLTSHESSGSG